MSSGLTINGSSKEGDRGLNQHTAELIQNIAFSDLPTEEKERAYKAVEQCSATIVQDCTFELEDHYKMTLWQMIHDNWLGGKPLPKWR